MYLRKLELKDAPLMLAWMHDKRVTANLRSNFASKTIEDAESFIRSSWGDKDNVNLVIASDEDEYMEKVYPTRRELEYTYVQKAGCLYDIKMIIYTVICIVYALFGKECTWILRELLADAKRSNPELDVQPHLI